MARFDAGRVTSGGGSLPLREVDQQTDLLRCFTDRRDPERLEHPLEHLTQQRV